MRKEKIPTNDFLASQLPSTRPALFKDLFLHETRTLVKTSLLLTLFALPLFCVFYIVSFLISSAYGSGASNETLYSLIFYGSIFTIPCFAIFYVGLAGTFQVCKCLSYGQGVLGASTFFYSLKMHYKRALVLGLIVGVSFFCLCAGSFYLLFFYQASPVITGIGIGLLIIAFLYLWTMSQYSLLEDCVYEVSFRFNLKNAFIFTFVRLPMNLVFFLLSPTLLLAMLLLSTISSYIALALFALFSAMPILLKTLYGESVFDRYINKDYYPEEVGRGLYKKEDKTCPK
jgi:hypothetical protein